MKVNVLSKRWLALLLAVLVSLGVIPVFQSAKAANDIYITYDANGGSFSDTGETTRRVQVTDVLIYPTPDVLPYLVAPDKSVFVGWSNDKKSTTGSSYDLYSPSEDETLYAIWEKYDVKVTFDAGRGFFDGDEQKHTADSYKNNTDNYWREYPNTPDWIDTTKVFDAWYTTKDYSSGRIEDLWNYEFTEDTVLYAKYIDSVTITYDFNGGTAWDGQTTATELVGKGKETYIWESFGKSPKPNQVISGWYDNAALKGLKIADYASFDDDITLYAKWADTWKVTVDMGEGDNYYEGATEAQIERGKEGTIGILPAENPLPNGKYYAGVYTGPNGTGEAVSVYTDMEPQKSMDGSEAVWNSDSVKYTPTKDTTLYAYWTKPIEVVFDANGGTLYENNASSQTYTVLPGKKLIDYSRSAQRSGYMFLGWATDKEGKNIVDQWTMLNKSMTLYAAWGDGYNITFDANGGKYWDGTTTFVSTIAKGEPLYSYDLAYGYSAPSDNQVLAGWYFDKACTKELNSVNSYVPTSNMTLYAGWTKGVVLTFDANGGSFYGEERDSRVSTETRLLAKGDRIGQMQRPDFSPAGKEFAGWYLDKQLTKAVDESTRFTEDATLYAKWVDYVRLVFDANGGKFRDEGSQSVYTVTAVPNMPIDYYKYEYLSLEKDGHYFAGWFYDKDGTRPFNPDGADISISNDTTVYAKWLKGEERIDISYYVGNIRVARHFVWREENGTLPDETVHYDVSQWNLEDFDIDYTKQGIDKKWYLDKQMTKPLTATSSVNNPVKVYGKLIDRFAVTLHWAEGRTKKQETVYLNAGTKMADYLSTVFVQPSKVLHMGWTLDKEGKKNVDANMVLSNDINLYEKTVEGVVTTLDFGEGEWVAYAFEGDTATCSFTEPGKALSEGIFEEHWMNAEKLQRGSNFYHYGDKLFQGWYEDKALTKKVANLADYVPKEDTTLYAKWARYGETDPTPVDPDPTTPDEPTPPTPDAKLNGVVQGADGRWALYKDGKVQTSYTGIAQNNLGWWRIVEGYVDFNATGIYQNEFGWWRVENGKVNFEADGVYRNEYGWWKTTDGKVTFHETGVYQNENGWWRTVDSKVDFSANGIYQNEFGWWKTTNGKVTFVEDGVYQNEYGWWKVDDSKVDFHFTGIAKNKFGIWYVKNGKVDFSKNGTVTFEGKTYTVKEGKVQ